MILAQVPHRPTAVLCHAWKGGRGIQASGPHVLMRVEDRQLKDNSEVQATRKRRLVFVIPTQRARLDREEVLQCS